MFYSHQLLARKAPLGQIWMAATMHAKINRKKLDKLNIIKICEEILNPSVPMALRLSGILMGGVVIVYERKVKLLFDDVSRFLVEINEAWKIKALPDPTVLPKGKSQAKYEAVTMPERRMMGTDEIEEEEEEEESLRFSNTTTTMQFHQEGFITMQLDHVEEPFINVGEPRGEEDLFQQHHQAETANITLFEPFNSYREEPSLYSRFERFDIEGDEDTHVNFTPYEYSQVPTTLIPSPPIPEAPQQAGEIRDQHPEPQSKQQSDEGRDEAHQVQHPEPQSKQESDKGSDKAPQVQQDEQRQGPTKRKTRRRQHVMDYEQTIIPGHVYQSWLQNPSDMVSKRGRKEKHIKPMSTMKTSHLMELPPVALVCGLSGNGTTSIHYPRPLLELWMRSTQLQSPHDSPSGRTSAPQPPEPVYSSAQDGVYQGPLEFPVEDFHSGIGSQPKQASIEKQMPNLDNLQFPVNEANLMFTPGNSGDNDRSIPSSASGNSFLAPEPDVQVPSGRSNIKRPYSSSRRSGSSLAPVAEENPWELPEPDFKLRRLSEDGFSHEQEILVETEPTPTQHPLVDHPIDKITDAIRKHLKTHFETPGAPQIESLDQLASGMNRKKAAQLFYQTCVLASHDLLRVQQTVAFADILISRGSKM